MVFYVNIVLLSIFDLGIIISIFNICRECVFKNSFWLIAVFCALLGINTHITNPLSKCVLIILLCIITPLLFDEFQIADGLFKGIVLGLIFVISDSLILLAWNLFTDLPNSAVMGQIVASNIYLVLHFINCFILIILLKGFLVKRVYTPVMISNGIQLALVVSVLALAVMMDICFVAQAYPRGFRIKLYLCLIAMLSFCILLILASRRLESLYKEKILSESEQHEYEMIMNQYTVINENNQKLRVLQHDLNNHLSVIQELLKQNQTDDLAKYLDDFINIQIDSQWTIFSGNIVIDAILTAKQLQMRAGKIVFEHRIIITDSLPLTESLWTSLLGNLMDNAMEACLKVAEVKRFIRLDIKPYRNNIVLMIENSCVSDLYIKRRGKTSKALTDKGIGIMSSKGEGHGLGLNRIHQIVSEADGFMSINTENGIFKITIILPNKRLENIVGKE